MVCCVRGFVADRAEGDIVKAVVGCAAAYLREELQPLHERGAHVVKGVKACLAGRFRQFRHIIGKAGLIDVDRLVGAEGGADLDLDGVVCRNLFVPFEGIDRVVGRADKCDVRLLDQPAHGHRRVVLQLVVAFVPDFLAVAGVQVAFDAEVFVQLEVAPVVHRVADRHFQRFDKFLEAFIARFAAGDIVFGGAVRAHDAPFVVVAEVAAVGVPAAQPDLREIVKTAVFVNFLGGDVAVVVDQRHCGGVVVVEVLCGFGFQQEILVHELFHLVRALAPFTLLPVSYNFGGWVFRGRKRGCSRRVLRRYGGTFSAARNSARCSQKAFLRPRRP